MPEALRGATLSHVTYHRCNRYERALLGAFKKNRQHGAIHLVTRPGQTRPLFLPWDHLRQVPICASRQRLPPHVGLPWWQNRPHAAPPFRRRLGIPQRQLPPTVRGHMRTQVAAVDVTQLYSRGTSALPLHRPSSSTLFRSWSVNDCHTYLDWASYLKAYD